MRFSGIVALGVLMATSVATPALSGPFAAVGDRQLRQDVDLLYAAGLIEGPVDSWPLPWAQIERGIDAAHDGRTVDSHVASAVARLERLADRAGQRLAFEARVSATNDIALARDFDSQARGDFDGAVQGEFNTDSVSVAAGVGYRTDQRNKDYHFEPAQVALTLGNWAVYGGYTEAWFGPGQDGALLFSNSARPMPKFGIKRLVPKPIDLPVLRWLGPIRLDLFVGILDEQRDHPDTAVVATRISFAPFKGFQFAASRMQQLCGRGRPCGADTIFNSFFGVISTGRQNDSTGGPPTNQAGNQIAGFDLSYTRRFGGYAGKLYFETEAEDSFLEQFGRLIGGTLTGPMGAGGASFAANIEYTDTFAADLLARTPLDFIGGKRVYPGSFYNNNAYADGYSYFRRPIGYWADGDARVLAGTMSVTDTHNRRWYSSARDVQLNITGLPNYRVSRSAERFALLTGGVVWPARFGEVKIEARYQTDQPDTPGRRDDAAAIEIGLRQRF